MDFLNNEFNQNNDYSEIVDLLNRIEKVNKIIALHQNNDKEATVIQQYMHQRDEFLDALQSALKPLQLSIQLAEPPKQEHTQEDIYLIMEKNFKKYASVFKALA